MKIKMRITSLLLTLVTIFTLFPSVSMAASEQLEYQGGWSMAGSYSKVVRSAMSETAPAIGTVYAYEGFTVLSNQRVGWFWIEYSTPSGTKRGYITSSGCVSTALSHLGSVNVTSTLYYGPNTATFQVSGTVYAGEFVSILAQSGNWAYVEYNTTQGRKRGFMPYSNLTDYSAGTPISDVLYSDGVTFLHSGTQSVYSGPSSQYPVIGSIGNEYVSECARTNIGGSWYIYVVYTVTGTSMKKAGWIQR